MNKSAIDTEEPAAPENIEVVTYILEHFAQKTKRQAYSFTKMEGNQRQ